MKGQFLRFILLVGLVCTGLGLQAQTAAPNCNGVNAGILQNDSISVAMSSFVADDAAYPINVEVQNQWGGLIIMLSTQGPDDRLEMPGCSYSGRTLKVSITNALGACWSDLSFKQGNSPVIVGSDTTVYCGDPLVTNSSSPPLAMVPCTEMVTSTFVADWVVPVDCDPMGNDTAKIIYREYEAFGKDGARGTGFDTIYVFRLPQISVNNVQCVEKDTVYNCGDGPTGRFGPFMVLENPPMSGECDTLYFLDENGDPVELDSKCGIHISDGKPHKFGNSCDRVTKYSFELKQTCFGTDPMTCPPVDPPSGLTEVSPGSGYWTCEFWLFEVDTLGPTFTGFPSGACDTIPTGSHDCVAHVKLKPVTAMDNCAGMKAVKAIVGGYGTFAFELVGGQWVSNSLVKIPFSDSKVKVIYEAFDSCHNVTKDSLYIQVKDLTKPVAVCDKGLTVSLSDKKVWVNASSFDEGSWDNCGEPFIYARRADWADFCVDLCDSLLTTTTIATGGDHHPNAINTPILNPDKTADPVEAHYAKTMTWLATDGQACSEVLLDAWYYDLARYAAENCPDPTNTYGFDQKGFDLTYSQTFNIPDLTQISQIGGGWSEQVPFDCSDACDKVTVEILAIDYWCNWSTCWMDVWVEDKTPVSIEKHVTDLEISCKTYRNMGIQNLIGQLETGSQEATAELDALLGGYKKVWRDAHGNYVDLEGNEVDCDVTIIDSTCFCEDVPGRKFVYDEHHGNIWVDTIGRECGYKAVSEAASHGVIVVNCAENVQCEQEVWADFDECGQGVVYRKFKIWKGCFDAGPSRRSVTDDVDTVEVLQRIWIGNECELDAGMFDFPTDTIIDACGIVYDEDGSGNVAGEAAPEFTGTVSYNFDDDCRIVGVGYYDKVFKVVGGDGGCYKILRTWCYTDWCPSGKPLPNQWWDNASFQGEVFKYTQKIVLQDLTPPEISLPPIGDIASRGSCDVRLSTVANITDACGLLNFSYQVVNIKTGAVVATGDGEIDGDLAASFGIDPDMALPTGDYRLDVLVRDACQNETSASTEFTATSDKKPGVVCVTSLTVELTPVDTSGDGTIDDGCGIIWANEYRSSMTPACSDDSVMVFIERLDGVGDDTLDETDSDSLKLTCADLQGIDAAESPVLAVRLWVRSYPSGSVDFCDLILVLQNNMAACGDISRDGGITGMIQNELDEVVQQVDVKATLGNGQALNFVTSNEGVYRIATALGIDVTVTPEKDVDHMNGISTADLIKIQKHILGKEVLSDEYRLMAADANDDGSVSALDLIALRRLILGIDDELQNSNSWRFANMIDGEESYVVSGATEMEVDFTGVKVGDVNLDSDPSRSAARSSEQLAFRVADRELEAGETYRVELHSDELAAFEGFQFTLATDETSVDILAVDGSEAWGIASENFGTQMLADGKIATSWEQRTSDGVSASGPVMTVTLRARNAVRLSDVLSINNSITTAEAYGSSEIVHGVALEFVGDDSYAGFELHQNQPNPFAQSTSIGFVLPQDQQVSLTIYDLTGKLIHQQQGDFAKGYNQVDVSKRDLIYSSGILYYQLDSEEFTATRKMIVLE